VVGSLEKQIIALANAQPAYQAATRKTEQLDAQVTQVQAAVRVWESESAPRLAVVQRSLDEENYALPARQSLVELEKAMQALGYDPAAHQAARQQEAAGRQAESELRELDKAQAAQLALEREISGLHEQLTTYQSEAEVQQAEYLKASAGLAEAEAQAPNLLQLEQDLFSSQERENQLRMDVGAARQKVEVLADLKTRRRSLEAEQAQLNHQIARYKQLERAFGRDGVPALLIEQALPQIEDRANRILDRLSGGGMWVRFVTQAQYKDKKRDDLKETLDIQISDETGTRDYEMYSGGEAFRVNFAVRLALSEVLAQRAGARLQMLVIDEGFGSQDAQGRQRLVEAINLIQDDFAKILVITHIDELKDVFPNRIEVEKTSSGSQLRLA
jgi:DNA repair protein SbcC/Rad50